jgi:NAD(P)-dependent dehydrogenase (short-subunit alcohol dehydrogenase family)
MSSVEEKTMVITGAAGGLGSALSMVASVNGWQVFLLDRNKRALELLYDAIVAAGGVEPYLHILDLANAGPLDYSQIVTAMQPQTGGLDALVHCAVSFDGLQPMDLIEPEVWLRQMQVNVNAPWLLSVNLLPLLRLRRSASLIFLHDEQPNSKALWGAYGVSKAATKALAAQFRAELRGASICVHAIDPGAMRTSLRSSIFHSENPANVPSAEFKATQLLSILQHPDKLRDFSINLTSMESGK